LPVTNSFIHSNSCPRLLFSVLLLFTLNLDLPAYSNPEIPLDTAFSKFYNLNQEDGLSHPEVYDILKDSTGYLWIATADGLNRYDGNTFEIFKPIPGDTNSLSYNWIWDLFIDSKDRMWVCTRQGLNLYHPGSNSFSRYFADGGLASNICGIAETPDGNLWLATWGSALIRFNPNTGEKEVFAEENNIKNQRYIRRISRDVHDNLWLATWGGVLRFRPDEQTFTAYFQDGYVECQHIISLHINRDSVFASSLNCPSYLLVSDGDEYLPQSSKLPSVFNNAFLHDAHGNFWIGSLNTGLYVVRKDGSTQRFYEGDRRIGTYSGTIVWSLFEDETNMLWVGTNKGINVLNPYRNQFTHVSLLGADALTAEHTVFNFEEGLDGEVWIGTDKGLYLFESKSGETTHFPSPRDFVQIYALKRIDNKLYLGTNVPYLFYFDLERRKYFKSVVLPKDSSTILQEQIMTISIDQQGNLLIGTQQKDAFVYDTYTNILKSFNKPGKKSDIGIYGFQKIFTDHLGNTWFGSTGGGLRMRKKDQNEYIKYLNHPEDSTSLANNIIKDIAEDTQGNIWIGTNGGLSCYQRKLDQFINYYEKDGLASNVITGIVADDNGDMWLSTHKGISRWNKHLNSFENYDEFAGVQQGVFRPSSAFKDSKGNLYFGGAKGFTFFNPKHLLPAGEAPATVITNIKVMNEERKDLLYQKSINLSYDNNFISFGFTALDFVSPSNIRYQYKLIGLEEDWVDGNKRRDANYTGLEPGNYTFMARASRAHGDWTNTPISIKISINPPWYLSKVAYLGYFLIFGLLIYGYSRFLINKERLKTQVRIREMESKKLKELDNLKSKFFSNISHEFRTPLTIINGMAKKIEENLSLEDKKLFRSDLQMITRNGNQLLRLANQVLDLAKLENNKLDYKPIQADVVRYLKYLASSYSSLAACQKINLTLYDEIETLSMDFDPEHLEKIVSNLLSNAIKNTSEYGTIIFHVSRKSPENLLLIKVKDSGIGIPEEIQDKIFERYFQGPSQSVGLGSGIGLSLTKELVTLMKGVISVTSKPQMGSEFLVQLPITNNAEYNELDFSLENPPEVDKQSPPHEIPGQGLNTEQVVEDGNLLVLLIEDNKDVASYIQSCLPKKYQTIYAPNGEVGVEQAVTHIPDVIISDVMMPIMDGYEVCRIIKADERTDHIPVIMLTAKASNSDKVAGLSQGADAYLFKPFEKSELLTQIEQLIAQRQKLIKKFSLGHFNHESGKTRGMAENQFLKKAIDIIHSELDTANFGPLQFARKLKLSESQVYRKVKAITGKSTAVFIRSVKLKKARQYIEAQQMNVSEAAYACGFNDPSWFSRAFKEEYGFAPTELKHH
jgi:signal transduction histidine kinase/ligand-binding sensor domain-containing protein/DNA-binding response OmpR family regulator